MTRYTHRFLQKAEVSLKRLIAHRQEVLTAKFTAEQPLARNRRGRGPAWLLQPFSAMALVGMLTVPADAFTGNWDYSWGDTKPSSVNIGSSVGRTCFLAGIGGHFRPSGAYLYSQVAQYPGAAGVRKKPGLFGGPGYYEIYVQPADGNHLIAYVRCVNTSAGQIEASWSSKSQASSGDFVIGPGSVGGTRQCFLTQIKNYAVAIKDGNGDIYSYGWAFDDVAHADEVRVFSDGSYWKLVVKPGAHTYPVSINASAVCINANEFHGWWTWKAGDPGSAQINLTEASGATCGLTGIRGHFNAALGDWDDGVYISRSGSQFELNMQNGKRGWAACMK